jgi:hypothetical protein
VPTAVDAVPRKVIALLSAAEFETFWLAPDATIAGEIGNDVVVAPNAITNCWRTPVDCLVSGWTE